MALIIQGIIIFFLSLCQRVVKLVKTTIGSAIPAVTPGQIVALNENPNLRIITTLFDGTNYMSWSKSATLFLKNRSKIGYVNGTITSLNVRDPGFDKWDQKTPWL